tara:strand:+ start:3647 stop:5431 length:1785 start_codon:yes stop_codon:yes gene_type:complete
MYTSKTNSSYWLIPPSGEKMTIMEMASTQTSISNFIRILTKKDIPVEYYSNNKGDSMTDGKSITISSRINESNIDSVVGLALHEGSHCLLSDFNFLKKRNNKLLNLDLLGHKNIIYLLHNFVEDRRIDNFIYKNAPGYQGYYNAMYERYFYNKHIDEGLKSSKYREEVWESYMFRIINIFNSNTDLKALVKLKEVYNIIDLKNIDRLKSTKDTFKLALDIYKIINSYISQLPIKKQERHNKNNVINKSFKSQENFINGKTPKSKTSKYIKELLNTVKKAGLKSKKVQFTNPEGVILKQPVTIIPNITDNLINNKFMDLFDSGINPKGYKNSIEKGLIKGKKLLKQLRVRNEEQRLETNHLKKGKLDSKRLYAANYTNDIFKKIDIKSYKKINIHLSIDGSGSMKGFKWENTLENTTAIAYVSTQLNNIDLKVSIRTTAEEPLSKNKLIPVLIMAFDSTKHNINHINKLSNFNIKGLTPEGICLEALNNYIEPSSYYLDSYLINMSDGMPTFISNIGKYKGDQAIKDTARVINLISKKRVKIMSYFIQGEPNSYHKKAENNFKQMYGRNAKFVDTNNINTITKTLNELFLKKNLI